MPILVLKIVMREEHLGNLQVVPRKKLSVSRHESRLANCGAGLQVGEIGRALGHVQHTHAGTHRAGGHDNHLPASFALGGHLADQLLNLAGINLLAAVGQDSGAKLDHHSAGIFQRISLHQKRLGLKASGPVSKKQINQALGQTARKVARLG